MRCRQARARFLERRAGLLTRKKEAGLEDHLRSCAACATDERFEEGLAADFALLRAPLPIRCNVTQRVMTRIAEIGRVDREEIPAGHLAWAGGAAVAVGLTVLFVGLAGWPSLLDALRYATRWTAALVQSSANLMRFALASTVPLFTGARALVGAVRAAGPALKVLEPILEGTIVFSIAAVTISTLWVVGRDLRPQALTSGPEER